MAEAGADGAVFSDILKAIFSSVEESSQLEGLRRLDGLFQQNRDKEGDVAVLIDYGILPLLLSNIQDEKRCRQDRICCFRRLNNLMAFGINVCEKAVAAGLIEALALVLSREHLRATQMRKTKGHFWL